MPMLPDVTFVVAAFDCADTIRRAAASALAQTGVSVEVIVVDDASRDETAQAAESARDPRLRVIRQARNGGPGAARNAGIEAARGRFLAVLDADDAVHPDRSARLLARLQASGAAAIVDNIAVVRDDARPAEPMFAVADLERLPELALPDFVLGNRLFRGGFNFGYLKPMLRTEALNVGAIRYPEDIRIGEDFLFLAEVLTKGGRCLVEPAVGYRYHVGGASLSRVLALGHVETMLAADRAFLARHAPDAASRAAWRARTRSLEEAAAFLAVVDDLKNRAPAAALHRALRAPLAMRHFRMPLAVRLRRWLAPGRPEKVSTS